MFNCLLVIFLNLLYSQNFNICEKNNYNPRSIYNIGDTLSYDDQSILYPVCNGNEIYEDGEYFSFFDLNGDINNNYKITIISMNATW